MVSVFAAPHSGQVIVELGVTRFSQAKTNPSAVSTAPRERAPVTKALSTAARGTRSTRRVGVPRPKQNSTPGEQADHSSGQQLETMRSGEERQGAEPRAAEAERAEKQRKGAA